jgi:hypothetical protein
VSADTRAIYIEISHIEAYLVAIDSKCTSSMSATQNKTLPGIFAAEWSEKPAGRQLSCCSRLSVQDHMGRFESKRLQKDTMIVITLHGVWLSAIPEDCPDCGVVVVCWGVEPHIYNVNVHHATLFFYEFTLVVLNSFVGVMCTGSIP